jgi:hypothetical protein
MIIALILIIIFPVSAFAYLDPGTGSIIFQSLIGIFFTGIYLAKLYWHKLKTLGKRFFYKEIDKNTADVTNNVKGSND